MHQHIIHTLKNASGYVSGEEISRSLHISRAGIWKYIQELRRLGYKIHAAPHLGYILKESPDRLLPWEIGYDLDTAVIGRRVEHHQVVASTMDEALRLASDGAGEGTVVCAERQTKGRGRLGRSWISPHGQGIYFSLILRPQVSPAEAAKFTLWAAVAVCEGLRRATELPVVIKWPNDLLIGRRKLGGILTELQAEADRVNFLVIGVGINVNMTGRQLPTAATSLRFEGGRIWRRVELMKKILNSLDQWHGVFQTSGFAPAFARWK